MFPVYLLKDLLVSMFQSRFLIKLGSASPIWAQWGSSAGLVKPMVLDAAPRPQEWCLGLEGEPENVYF